MKHGVPRLNILLWILLFGVSTASGHQTSQPPKTGDLAPKLEIARMLQGPSAPVERDAELSGKVIVLELWATWCGPYVTER